VPHLHLLRNIKDVFCSTKVEYFAIFRSCAADLFLLSAIALPLVVPVRIQLLRLNRAGKAVLPHLIAVQDTTTDLDRRALIVMAASTSLEEPISLVTAA
jgi:hypothetical protein